ncbi:MAG: permease [Dehalogenimonas sp.]|uniref:Permease n=1 Tax=Candidatus Dehalogenimonas loeffleri TaxID=3127115 RepID=A0ABZ2J283_9CHLR|nr:permease [Dehalogenimonas sp.]
MKQLAKKYQAYVWIAAFAVAMIASFAVGFNPGTTVFTNFRVSLVEMLSFLPFLFIIVGLFDVWVPKEKIQKHIGHESGIKGIALVVLLAMLQAGPLYGAFPIAYILYKKGISPRNLFIYLGAFSSLKIPMLGIEIGYLGIEFTLARTLISLPLFIAIGYLMERFLKGRQFEVFDGGNNASPKAGA